MKRERMIIIDGNSLINRAFYALPPLVTKEGQYTNAIYGFTTMLLKVIDEYNPQYIGVAFDLKAPTFRHKEFSGYKLGRKGMPDELRQQIQPLKELLDAMNIFRIELEGFEADDLIGTLGRYCERNDIESLIVTGDRDALQLASDKIKILITKKGISSLEIYDDKKMLEEYEVTPLQFIDVKALMGDKSDNIPGVPGVGEKTAIKLIKEYGSAENLIVNYEKISAAKLREKIENHIKDIILSKRLATIITDIPVEFNLDKLRRDEANYEELVALLRRFEFNSLVGRFSKEKRTEAAPQEGKVTTIENIEALSEALSKVKKAGLMAFKTVTAEENMITDQIVAIGFGAVPEEIYTLSFEALDFKVVLKELKQVLEDEKIKKLGHDMKREMLHFLTQGIEIKNIDFDTMIGEYLIDSSKSSYHLKELSAFYLNENISDEDELLGKGKNRKSYQAVEHLELHRFLGQQVRAILQLTSPVKEKLKALEVEDLYYQVELPLTEVLATMEYYGIKVDKHMLMKLEIEFSNMINQLTEEIYQLAGEPFNINSPKQLGEILFERLSLPPIKKTKTGFSTNAEVLEKLQGRHEIIPKILEYRQVTKLKSTYVDGLLNIINPVTGRIHSSFNQTVTTTGRISSTEPNLQNIPVKLEMGKQLRKVFVAEGGCQFIDADYSQIELRVLAHISGDENLLDAFEKNQDIHTRTASEIFDVPMEEVTSIMRSSAKAVNFGIVYGISDFGLGENLKISRVEAKKYIDSYLDKYPAVRRYMKEIVENAKEQGYVLTMLHRRRYLPELKSSNFNIRSFGERMAMNTPIQGSAADIIKIAMVEVYRQLKQRKYEAKLILQVHDELIVEVPNKEREEVAEIVRSAMEKAVALKTALKVDLSIGNNWYEAK